MDLMLDTRQHLNAVIDDEHLAVATHLQLNRLFDDVLVVRCDQLRLYRVSIRRRSRHDTQIACPQQTELQRTRNRRCRERQHIHVRAKTLQLLLHRHTEFLFLVDDQQSQVVPFDTLADNLMRADQDIYLACRQILQYLFRLFRTLQTTQVLNPNRHICHSLAERVVVLQRQYGRRN